MSQRDVVGRAVSRGESIDDPDLAWAVEFAARRVMTISIWVFAACATVGVAAGLIIPLAIDGALVWGVAGVSGAAGVITGSVMLPPYRKARRARALAAPADD